MHRAAVRRGVSRWAGVLLLVSALAHDASAAAAAGPARARIGLALSGGGARGAAHIGVLQVLEEHRIPVDFVAGTSMGALVGGLYASGLSPAELDSVIGAIDWGRTFADDIPRADRSFRRKRDDDLYLVEHKPGLRGGRLVFPSGILDGHRVDLLLKRLSMPVVMVRDFDDLAIPYRAVAADIVNGESVILGGGDLALAMRASMSIPAAFAPREIDGRLLVDGGIVNNFPIELVRGMGADVVIAVDIASPCLGRDRLRSVVEITRQLTTIMSEQEMNRQIGTLVPPDVFLRPDLGRIGVESFDQVRAAVEIGRRAAEAALDTLRHLALSAEEYRAHQAARATRAARRDPPTIAEVRIVNRSRLADAVLATHVDTPIGAPLDVARLERGLEQIYGLEVFESVYYDVTPGPRGNVLTVTARERAWGPDYLQAGVAVFDDFERPNFNVALAYSRTAINRWNGEWRLGSQVGQEPVAWAEWYQPLDRHLRDFVHAEVRAGKRPTSVFDGSGHKISELGITRFGGSLAVGRELGTWGEVRAGLAREAGRIRVQVGDPAAPATRYDTGELFGEFRVDRLDEVAFPHRGGSLRAHWNAGLEALGSTTEYEQMTLEGAVHATRGITTGMLGALGATTLDSDAPFEKRFRLGGFTRLSGLEQDERVGQHAMLLRAGLYRRIAEWPVLSAYVGVLSEFGDVFPSRSAIQLANGIASGCVFLGAHTVLGPLCLAYGRAEGGRGNYFVTLGQPLGGPRPGSWSP